MEDAVFGTQEIRLHIRRLDTPVDGAGTRNEVTLEDSHGRTLRISIGACEAMSILRRLDAEQAPSPVEPRAHDLILEICSALDASVEKVVIDDLWHLTYYAKLHLLTRAGEIAIDARPSDAMALALRAGAPIFATEAVMVAGQREEHEGPE